MNVLCIEDDRRIASVLKRVLVEEGNHVTLADSGVEGEEHLLSGRFDIAILDLMLPGINGFEVLRRVREARSRTPVLVLSAREGMPDIIRALDLGADDYLTKPFELEMLLARVRSVSRRGPTTELPVLQVGDLRLDRARHEVSKNQTPLPLTKREYALLEYLMRRSGRAASREQLMEAGWGLIADVSNNNLEFQIHSLRNKIDDPGEPSRIRTVRGIGYLLEG